MKATQSHAGAISIRSHMVRMTMKATQSHASSAGAISIRSHIVWMTMKVTQSHASSVGASDQSSAGAISIRGLVLTPNVLALAFPNAFCRALVR